MKSLIYFCFAILLFTSCKKNDDAATPKTEEKENSSVAIETPKDSAAIAKIWNDYAAPNDAHKRLAEDVGKWNETCKFYMEPGKEPMVMEMTVDVEMIYGGRFQKTTHKGNMYGAPFEGSAITGYDNATGQYFSTWMDNMSTGTHIVRGTFDDATKTYNYTGETSDPMTKSLKKVRETVQIVDANKQIITSYEIEADGKERKTMEITMTRA